MSSSDRVATPIKKPVVVLVEGKTPRIFFEALIGGRGLARLEVRDFGSVKELGPYLQVLAGRPEFRTEVGALGIIRDAEAAPAQSAFQSVNALLHRAGLPNPGRMNTIEGEGLKCGVFILPDCQAPGMLETLCLRYAQERPEFTCVEEFFACVMARRLGGARLNTDKVKAAAFIAAQNLDLPAVGRAAQAGVWNWNSPVFSELLSFLAALNDS